MPSKDFFVKYLEYLINLNNLHSSEWKERTLITPTLLSEGVCKFLLNLEDRVKGAKDHDAQLDGEKYEIKATSDEQGTTTYNPASKVDKMIWVFLIIKKKNYALE